MQIKSVIINDIHYINFITLNFSTFFSWSAQLKLECILYAIKYGNLIFEGVKPPHTHTQLNGSKYFNTNRFI